MATLVLLLDDEKAGTGVGSAVARRLADLGVTSVSVLSDEKTTAVILEGWAFDLDRSSEAATRLLVADPSAVRVLRPVLESAIHASFATSTATMGRRHT